MLERLKNKILPHALRLAKWAGYNETKMMFYAETSRVYQGETAPQGSIFFIMRSYNSDIRRIASIMLPTKGMTDEYRVMVFEKLLDKIKAKYGL